MKQIKYIYHIYLCTLVLSVALLQSCKKDNLSEDQTELNITFNSPANLTDAQLTLGTITFSEVNSGATTTREVNSATHTVVLPQGVYTISFEGTVNYQADDSQASYTVRAYQEGAAVTGSTSSLSLDLFTYNSKSGLVFKEIFFTGTVTPEGKAYNGDKYFIIYNNSDETVYADGLAIAESDFLTTTKRQYTPDIMSSAFTSQAIVVIPGTGKDYPVAPGASIIIANNAINHLEYNRNSIDLSKSSFELALLPSINVDNPQVTDLINASSFMTMHNRGFKSYVLADLGETIDEFKATNAYTHGYIDALGNTKQTSSYKIANEKIVDAVNLSVSEGFEWIVTSPVLDMGWTHCGRTSSDNNRYGKSVRRKVLSTENGREVLKDTNNSTEDFDAEVKPSLMQ